MFVSMVSALKASKLLIVFKSAACRASRNQRVMMTPVRLSLWAMTLALLAQPAMAADRQLAVTAVQRQQLGIRTASVQPVGAVPMATLPAMVVPPPGARVAVSAPFPGVIRQSYAVAGQTVRQGDALATVFSRDVLEIGAELARAHAREAVARSAAVRTDQLAKEGIVAGARAEEARAAWREVQADVASRSRLLSLAHADAATGLYTLRAPIAGRVSSASAATGGAIDGMAAPFVIDATNRFAIEAQLPERFIGQVRAGDRIMLPGGGIGIVTTVGVTIDPQTRAAILKASVPALPGLVAGRAISVGLMARPVAGAVSVPAAAVVRVGGQPMVFCETAGGFAMRPVTLVTAGGGAGANTVVTGLPTGTRVAVSGVSELKALGLAAAGH
jgi:cobalt-zinc-cadmium efflux system membrane fusion protein